MESIRPHESDPCPLCRGHYAFWYYVPHLPMMSLKTTAVIKVVCGFIFFLLLIGPIAGFYFGTKYHEHQDRQTQIRKWAELEENYNRASRAIPKEWGPKGFNTLGINLIEGGAEVELYEWATKKKAIGYVFFRNNGPDELVITDYLQRSYRVVDPAVY